MKKIVIASMVAVLMLSSCQATPEEPIVVGKDLQTMLDKAADKEENSPYISKLGIPEHLIHEFNDGKVHVNIDAQITLPQTDTISVSRVAHGDFSQEQADTLWKTLLGDTPMYLRLNNVLTKAQIEQYILEQERIKSIPDEQLDEGGLIKKEYADIEIAYYEELYASAPEEISVTPVTSEFVEEEYSELGANSRYLQISATSYDGITTGPAQEFYIRTSNQLEGDIVPVVREDGSEYAADTISDYVLFNYRIHEKNDSSSPTGTVNVKIGLGHEQVYPEHAVKPEFTYEQAIETVQDFIADIGATDYLSVETQDVRVDYLVEMQTDILGSINTSEAPTAEQLLSGGLNDAIVGTRYYVNASRMVDGVPVHSTYADVYLGGDAMSAFWPYENLQFTIEDGKFIDIWWRSPHAVTDTLVDQAAMLPFDEVIEIFEKMTYVTYAPSPVDYAIDIDRMELSLMRITEQNNLDYGILVPVWTFYGSADWVNVPDEYKDVGGISGENGYAFDNNVEGKVMIINAIDGSLIDVPLEMKF